MDNQSPFPRFPGRVASAPAKPWHLVDMIIYPRSFEGTCSGCWRPRRVHSVELSATSRYRPKVVRWAARAYCLVCVAILEPQAEGKVTYCAF